MTYPNGLHVAATCDAHDVTGTLVGDHDELDGTVSIRETDTGEILRLNGWLWLFEITGTACDGTELEP
jgi:hypothetical protein